MVIEPYNKQVQEYVGEHIHFEDEPLILAIRYLPISASDDIYLLEVTENIGSNLPDPDKEICTAGYKVHWDSEDQNGLWLHLAITNPVELTVAVEEQWLGIKEITHSVRAGRYEVVYQRDEQETNIYLDYLGRIWNKGNA